MYNIAKLSNNDRDIVFTKYAFENGVSKAIVEKDFWVTLILDYLFHRCKYKDYFIFKGGTSLSKCFNIIERFSEDIDLILRWDLLTDDNPNKERSNRQQDIYNKNINKLAADFIKEKLMPEMIYDFNNLLGQKAEFQIDENEPQVLNFNYPRLYNDDAGILKFVRLEIGPLAALTPTEDVTISPLISKLNLKLSLIFPQPSYDERINLYPERFRKGFIRFSVGLEDPDDIIVDLNQALKSVGL